MIISLLLACAFPSVQVSNGEQPASVPEVLVFHPAPESGAESQVIQEVLDALDEAPLSPHDDSELAELAGPDAGRDPRLQVYHALKRSKARRAWTLRFVRFERVVSVEAFDMATGVRAHRGTKIRSLAENRLSGEHLVRLKQMIGDVRQELVDKSSFLEASAATPYVETITWKEFEDPALWGFRWRFEEAGARVTFVYESSSLQEAGLRVGDRIVTVNGVAVPSPAHLGRQLGPLKAGHELNLTVARGESTVELAGKVESSAELIPRWQARIVGKKAPVLTPAVDDASRPATELGPRPTLVVVFDPLQPDTWASFAVVRWLRDHAPKERLAILGIATNTDELSLNRFLAELKPGWPSRADPQGELTESLRVHRPPATLLIDGSGDLRFRQVDESRLRLAIDTLLREAR